MLAASSTGRPAGTWRPCPFCSAPDLLRLLAAGEGQGVLALRNLDLLASCMSDEVPLLPPHSARSAPLLSEDTDEIWVPLDGATTGSAPEGFAAAMRSAAHVPAHVLSAEQCSHGTSQH